MSQTKQARKTNVISAKEYNLAVSGKDKPTQAQFTALQSLFDYFNASLFDNKLPQCILNLQRHKKCYGYFWPNRWASAQDFVQGEDSDETENDLAKLKDDVKTMHEISLNPESLSRSPQRVLSTLVHEMCHLQREITGKPPRGNYHDKAWAEMMLKVGLTPYNTKDPDKMTGQSCSHHIDKGGRYQKAFYALPPDLLLPFTHVPVIAEVKAASKSGKKEKYTCPQCEANVWGKPGTNVLCGDCEDDRGRPCKMLAEGEEPNDQDDQDLDDDQDDQ